MSEEKAERSPYTVVEAAAKLNMSEFAVRAALRRGALPGFKLGRDWRVLPTQVDRLVSEPPARKS
jgi:excisionase family DNA binding protein